MVSLVSDGFSFSLVKRRLSEIGVGVKTVLS